MWKLNSLYTTEPVWGGNFFPQDTDALGRDLSQRVTFHFPGWTCFPNSMRKGNYTSSSTVYRIKGETCHTC